MIFIKYRDNGDILSVSNRAGIEREPNILSVNEIPNDFLATFALGKYTITEGRIDIRTPFPLPKLPAQDCFFPSPLKLQASSLSPTGELLEELKETAEQMLESPPKAKSTKKKAKRKSSVREKIRNGN